MEKIDQLSGWYSIKRRYISGIILTIIGTFALKVGLLVVFYFFPDQIIYHYNMIIYNGPLIRIFLEILILGIGGLLLLIGLPLLIINTIKKKKF